MRGQFSIVSVVFLFVALADCSNAGSNGTIGFGGATDTGGFGSGTGSGTGGSISAGSSSGSTGFGNVAFTWTFVTPTNQTLSCAAAGLETVEIQIGGNQIYVPCQGPQGQTATVDGVTPSDAVLFSVFASGGDGGDIVASSASDLTVAVVAGETTPEPVALSLFVQTGDVGLAWDLGGLDCVQAGVGQIQVLAAGMLVGSFPCSAFTDASEGATLSQLPVGKTDLELRGLGFGGPDAGPIVAWAGDAGVAVSTQISLAIVELSPVVSDAGSTAFLQWTFDGLSCGDAGQPNVALALSSSDGGTIDLTLPCAGTGIQATEGTIVGGLAAGAYDFTLSAQLALPDDAGVTSLTAGGTFYANGSSDVMVLTDLGPENPLDAGTLTLGYLFDSLSCADAGIDGLEALLLAPTGALVSSAPQSCSTPTTFGPLSPGLYTLDAAATAADLTQYAIYGLSVTVVAGTDSSYTISLPVVHP